MTAERQRRALDATGQPALLKMVVEPPQTVDVDRAVVDPDNLTPAGGSGRPLEVKYGLVDQIEYVAHLFNSLSCQLPTDSGRASRWWPRARSRPWRPKDAASEGQSSWRGPADRREPRRRPVPA